LDPAKPLPWAKGTWDWWKYTRIYFLIALGFLPFAVWDEFCHACIATEKFIAERIKKEREKEEERKKHSPTPATGGQTVATDNKGGATIGFKIFSWSFLADAAGAFMFEFLDHRRKRS
jgi:hypothetical protein